jgi:hypothetical protein
MGRRYRRSAGAGRSALGDRRRLCRRGGEPDAIEFYKEVFGATLHGDPGLDPAGLGVCGRSALLAEWIFQKRGRLLGVRCLWTFFVGGRSGSSGKDFPRGV